MNIQQIMQQAKAMQEKMAQLQERAGQEQVTGVAGGGMVAITMTCKGHVDAVKIAPEAIDPSDVSILEDLIKAAANDAKRKGDEHLADGTRRMMEEMGLPANFQLPF